MVIKTIGECDSCGKVDEHNPNYNAPNGWYVVDMHLDGQNIVNWNGVYCSKKCIMDKLDNQSASIR